MSLPKMLTQTKKRTRRPCSRVSGASSHVSRVTRAAMIFLVLCLATGQHVAHVDGNQTDSNTMVPSVELSLPPTRHTKELELSIVQSKNFTLIMYDQETVKVNVTLYCSHPSVAYSIRVTTEDTDIAEVSDFQMFNITCANLALARGLGEDTWTPTPDGKQNTTFGMETVSVVRGSFNFTVRANLLGRTWLHVFGKRYADAGTVIPDFLRLPWNTTKPSKTDSRRAPSANVMEVSLPTDSKNNKTSRDSHSVSDISYRVAASDGSIVTTEAELQKHVVTVMKVIRPVDKAFRSIVYGFVIMATIGMGCKTEISVVREVLKKPIAPAIGFFCQYLFMPLIAFMLAKTVVRGDPALSLGIFTCGICPGGGPSNFFSLLLDGDVSLSVTMTAISSIAALGMIPMWLFTLGTKFEDDKISLNVPFTRILMTLLILILPLFIGMAIKKCLPKVAKWIMKILKPFTLILILFLITFGTYVNLYVFSLFSPRTILAGCLLPYIGYILGASISLLIRQPCYRVKTIAIETGIQNTSIAYLLLVFSLPVPDADMAAVAPMASAMMTPLPLLVLVVVYLSYKRCSKKKKKEEGEGEGREGDKDGGVKEEEEIALRGGEGPEENGDVQNLDSGEM